MSYEPPDQPGVLGAVDGKKPAHTTTNAGGLASPAPTASAATSHAATKAVPHHVIATFTGRVGMQLVDEGDRITVIFAETLVRVSGRPAVELLVAQSAGPAEQALLVIHGGPDWDHSYLRDPLAELAGRRRLVMPDIRGCGRSTCGLPADQYTPDAVVADLLALLDRLGLTQVDLLGFSYGGLLAQRLAVAEPARIRRLIIASSSVCPVPPDAFNGWRERTERLTAEAAAWANPELSGPELVRAEALASAPANVWRDDRLPDYLSRLAAVRFTAEWLRSLDAGILPPARPPHAAQRLAALGTPILLLHGAQDMTFPADLATEAAAIIPAARAVILDDAGHMAHIDQPVSWLAALTEFLDETSA